MAISSSFDIARRALLAQEVALAVTGNNIANVNTPGYTRQIPELAAEPPTGSSDGVLIGRGVRVRQITQAVDPLIARRLLASLGDRGRHSALAEQLGALGETLNEQRQPSLGSALSKFFDAADGLARNPGGLGERETLLGTARALASEFGSRSQAIAAQQRAIDDGVVALAAEANGNLEKVAQLNHAIVAAEANGQVAGDLRDQRQLLVNVLGEQLGLHGAEDASGAIRLTAAATGTVLVDGGQVVRGISTRPLPPTPAGLDGLALHEVGFTTPAGGFISLPAAFDAGELGGLLEGRDVAIPAAQANLDVLANGVRTSVNSVLTSPGAIDLDGNPGVPLFGGTGAADLAVVLTDPRRIAAARSVQPGDNQNATALADLRTALALDTNADTVGDTSFAGYLAEEQGRIGSAAALADDTAKASALLTTQLEQERSAVSGVNLNEELTNLLRYQRAFQAAARIIDVTNQTLDDLFQVL